MHLLLICYVIVLHGIVRAHEEFLHDEVENKANKAILQEALKEHRMSKQGASIIASRKHIGNEKYGRACFFEIVTTYSYVRNVKKKWCR